MSETLQITLPDGSSKQVAAGTTVADFVKTQIGAGLAKAALYARLDDEDLDLSRPLNRSGKLTVVTSKQREGLDLIRHDAAHVVASVVQRLFPGTQVTIGPHTEDGFYYDFFRKEPFTPEDLEKIEKAANEEIRKDLPFVRKEVSREEALQLFEKLGEKFKLEIVEDIFNKGAKTLTLYSHGDWVDFCLGPHAPSTGRIGVIKLLSVAGAYWRGDHRNPQLQRIYGTAFFEKKDLDARDVPEERLPGDQDAAHVQQDALGAQRPLGQVPGEHVPGAGPGIEGRERRRAGQLLAQADELPFALPVLPGEEAQLPRAADPVPHAGRAAPERGHRRPLRADARAPVPAGRRAHLPDGVADRRRGEAADGDDQEGLPVAGAGVPGQVRNTTPAAHRRRRDVGSRGGRPARRGGADRRGLGGEPRRRRVLRAQARLRGEGQHRPRMAAGDHPARLQRARAVRARLRGRRQQGAPAGGDPPRHLRQLRAVRRHPDRAFRRQLPGLAGAHPGPHHHRGGPAHGLGAGSVLPTPAARASRRAR